MDNFLPNTPPEEEIEFIDKWLDNGIENGVEIEMIYYSLLAMKKNPNLSVIEALVEGFNEWIK